MLSTGELIKINGNGGGGGGGGGAVSVVGAALKVADDFFNGADSKLFSVCVDVSTKLFPIVLSQLR